MATIIVSVILDVGNHYPNQIEKKTGTCFLVIQKYFRHRDDEIKLIKLRFNMSNLGSVSDEQGEKLFQHIS